MPPATIWLIRLFPQRRLASEQPVDDVSLELRLLFRQSAAKVMIVETGSIPPMPRHPPPARWLVYLLRCSDGSLYTGITNDLLKRLKAHAAGKASRYTRSRLPVAVAYSEPQPTKSAALKREVAIKRMNRSRKEQLIEKL